MSKNMFGEIQENLNQIASDPVEIRN